MYSVGIRELKEHTGKIMRQVREQGDTVEVTYHGRAIARLSPIHQSRTIVEETAAVWTDLDQLAAEIDAHWTPDVSAAEAVRAGRREL